MHSTVRIHSTHVLGITSSRSKGLREHTVLTFWAELQVEAEVSEQTVCGGCSPRWLWQRSAHPRAERSHPEEEEKKKNRKTTKYGFHDEILVNQKILKAKINQTSNHKNTKASEETKNEKCLTLK